MCGWGKFDSKTEYAYDEGNNSSGDTDTDGNVVDTSEFFGKHADGDASEDEETSGDEVPEQPSGDAK